MKKTIMHRYFYHTGSCLVLALFVAACTPTVAQRGNMVDDERLQQLKIGTSTRSDVLGLFGTPTTQGTFDDRTWYYIGQHVEQTGVFAPDITEQRVVKLVFDPATGTLRDMKVLGKDDARDVSMIDRETPTKGKELTVIQQMLGNLGKFSAPDKGFRPGTGGPSDGYRRR